MGCDGIGWDMIGQGGMEWDGWDIVGWDGMGLNGSVQHCFTRAQQGQAQCSGGHMFQHCRRSGIHLPRRPWCFPSRAGAIPRGWGQPWPLAHLLPVYFLTLKYHLEDKHSLVWGTAGISLAAEAGPGPQGAQHPNPTMPPKQGMPGWAGIRAATSCSGHVPSMLYVPCRVP